MRMLIVGGACISVGVVLGVVIMSMFTAGRIAQLEAAVSLARRDMAMERVRGWLDALSPTEEELQAIEDENDDQQ